MNPDPTIRVGDRVKIKSVRVGYPRTYVGRTATVKRIEGDTVPSLADFYSYPGSRERYGFGPSSVRVPRRYLVELEGLRPEQVYATHVEKLPAEPEIAVGDRVIIREGFTLGARSTVVGRVGEVLQIAKVYGRTRYTVRTPQGVGDLAARVEKVSDVPNYDPPTAETGDQVVVTRVRDNGSQVLGRVGSVRKIEEPYQIDGTIVPRRYLVRFSDGTQAEATRVTKLAAADIPAWEKELLAIPTAKTAEQIDAEASDLPRKNLQAATFAHNLLGPSADLDKLIGVAEFVMDRRTLGTETTGTVGVLAEPKLQVARPADRTLRDADGDEMHLSIGAGVAIVNVNNDDAAYLSDDNLDAAIAFLTQARAYLRK